MAEIPVRKKTSSTWIWVLLAVIVAALLIWWAAASDDDAEVAVADTAPMEAVETATPTVADTQTSAEASPVTLSAILAQPQTYIGREYTGEVDVSGPLTDRGFWIESDGVRMFALIIDQPREVPLDINAGQRLRITGGTVREGGVVTDLEGVELKENTRDVLQGEDVFMLVDESDIEILSRA